MKEKKLKIRRGGTHIHKESDKWYFTVYIIVHIRVNVSINKVL